MTIKDSQYISFNLFVLSDDDYRKHVKVVLKTAHFTAYIYLKY